MFRPYEAFRGPTTLDFDVKLQRGMPAFVVSFIAGGAYGLTSVAVGQPFDTVKTRMQARPDSVFSSAWRVTSQLLREQGVLSLYRGGFPVVLGGTIFRSVHFGVYEATLGELRRTTPPVQKFLALDLASGGCRLCRRHCMWHHWGSLRSSEGLPSSGAWTVSTLFQGFGVTILHAPQWPDGQTWINWMMISRAIPCTYLFRWSTATCPDFWVAAGHLSLILSFHLKLIIMAWGSRAAAEPLPATFEPDWSHKMMYHTSPYCNSL